MNNSTQPLDLEALRAKRVADILSWGYPADDTDCERDEVGERLAEGLCAACEAPCPGGLCEDCAESGAHVAGPGITSGRDALPSLPAAGPESVAVLLGIIERLRTAHRESSQLAEAVAGIGHVFFDQLDETRAEVEQLQSERDRLGEALDDAIEENAKLAAEVERLRAFVDEADRIRVAVGELADEIIAAGTDAEGEAA